MRGRAFQPRQVDRRAHSPEVLIRAMELLGDPRVEFRHLGPMDSENQRLFQSSRVQNLIKAVGYLEHRATLAELSSADAAYLCLATCLGEERNELPQWFDGLRGLRPTLGIAVLCSALSFVWVLFSPVRSLRGQPTPVESSA